MDSYSGEVLTKVWDIQGLHDSIDALCGYPVDFISEYEGEGLFLFKSFKRLFKDLISVDPTYQSVT